MLLPITDESTISNVWKKKIGLCSPLKAKGRAQMFDRIALDLPPLNLHDAVQQSHNLVHPALLDEVLDPSHGLVAEQKPQLV